MKKVLIAIITFAILAVVGVTLLLQRQTYAKVDTIEYYESVSTDNPGYVKYLDGVMKYTRDGVALLNKSGEEIWNQPCQMGNPFVEVRDEIAIVYDRNGTSVLVLEEKGLKGEIKTVRPIEKISVSNQGIVASILKNDENPMIVCYDAAGNVLVEQSASLDNTGYPMDLAISEDGNTLIVSYLMANGAGLSTKIVYYDFGDQDIDKKNHAIHEVVYENVVIPMVDYIEKDKALFVADDGFIIYERNDAPAEVTRVSEDVICNVSHSDNVIALIVKVVETSEYKLKLFDKGGQVISVIPLEREYAYMNVCDGQVLLYEGAECCIYTKGGVCKYDGEVDGEVLEMFPLFGLNKYMMINANGFYKVRLAN